MSSDWKCYKIDDLKKDKKGSIAIGPFGSRMKSDCYVDKGVPVIRGTNIGESKGFKGNFVFITEEKAKELGSSNVYKGDLVFPHRGSIGEVGIISEDKHYVLSSSLMKLSCNEELVNNEYLYYFFKTREGRHELLKNASQVGTPGIGQPLTSLRGIEVRLPKKDVQDRIVQILNSVGDKIANNNRINQSLEDIAQALFKSWFVDFEPVKAKMKAKAEGKDPHAAVMCALSGKAEEELHLMTQETYEELALTANLFPDNLVGSEFGLIPEGWGVNPLGSYFEVNPQRTLRKGTIAPFLDMKNMPTIGHLANDVILKEVTSGIKYINGDTLLARITPCLQNGKTTYVDFLNEDEVGWGSTEYIVLRSKNNISIYASYLLSRYQPFRNYSIQSMTGSSGRQRANAQVIKEYPLCFPEDKKLHNAFHNSIVNCFKQIKNNGDQNKILSQIRDTLLPKLLSGELNINNNA